MDVVIRRAQPRERGAEVHGKMVGEIALESLVPISMLYSSRIVSLYHRSRCSMLKT